MLVRFLKNHTPYLAGETASFAAAQAAAFIAKGVAVAVTSTMPGRAEEGSDTIAEQLESLLAGFRQRGIDVDPTTPIGDLMFHAESILSAERAAAEATKSATEGTTGPTANDDGGSNTTPTDGGTPPEPKPEASEGQRRTVTPPRVARSAQ
ncbi:hypothetical protein ABMY26_23795 [Azospirillum sp. HJ39]|uniref:hypothetical protein n=1 Tax=Azospirillum sp. HJ39 TaxID=3159496 RepID=UPI0035575C4D